MKTTTVIISQSPLKTIRITEALRMSVGLTLCDEAVQVLFVGDGVYTLLDTEPAQLGMPDYSRHLETLIQLKHRLFAERESLDERALGKISDDVEIIPRNEVAKLLLATDCVVRY
jgi:sulfur relay (sulfurtransferase) DsrF/TusC family protein